MFRENGFENRKIVYMPTKLLLEKHAKTNKNKNKKP